MNREALAHGGMRARHLILDQLAKGTHVCRVVDVASPIDAVKVVERLARCLWPVRVRAVFSMIIHITQGTTGEEPEG